jgi:hypothetical protein
MDPRRLTFAHLSAPSPAMYLLDAEIAQRELGRRLEWLAVANPQLASTARAAHWLAGRIRGDRLGEVAA